MSTTITSTLNEYGGLISLIGLLFSIIVVIITGKIKKNIKLIFEHKDFNKQRSKLQDSLKRDIQSICENIQTDKIFDIYLIAEIEEIIGVLEQHKKILPLRLRFELLSTRYELHKEITSIDQELICKKLSHIKGSIKNQTIYIG